MARPLIALLTDFGTADTYVGSMKGVILGICPDAAIVDITHEIAPHDVREGALELEACRESFPGGTVFLAVVDPGVGSRRRGLAARCGEHRFVAPDNGILAAVFRAVPPSQVVELADRRFARHEISRTFEGRDRFAPAAAWLAAGTETGALGPPITDYVTLDLPTPVLADGVQVGIVVRVDRFGNIVTNIDRGSFARLAPSGIADIRVGAWRTSRLVQTYADLAPAEIGAMFGSRECLEVCAREASAAAALDVRRGDRVTVLRVANGDAGRQARAQTPVSSRPD
jgi:S-adenosylmethionine hydrolase